MKIWAPSNLSGRGFNVCVFVFPGLILLTPFLSFLKFQGYPLFTAEVVYLLAVVITLGSALGAIAKWGGKLGTAFVFSITVVAFADFQFELRLTYLAIASVFILASSYFFARAMMPVITIVAAVVLLSTLFLPAQLHKAEHTPASAEDVQKNLRPIVHIVLDEHIGIEGIDINTIEGQTAKVRLKNFYQKNGFRLFGGAYSNYAETFNSLPNLLNSTLLTKSFTYIGEGADRLPILTQNLYFERLAQLGYGFRIYQSKYFNYCADPNLPVISCDSYNYTGLDNLDSLTDDWSIKSNLITARFLNRSRIYGLARSVYQRLAVAGFFALRPIENQNFAPLASLPFFDLLRKDLSSEIRGQVFFAHLLIPHRPFMFNSRCELVLDQPYSSLKRRSEPWLAEYEKSYYEQVTCTTRKIKEILDALDRSDVGKSALVIIHGDHGSRIGPRNANIENWDSFDAKQVGAYFSTLFAIKGAGIKPGYDNRLFSLHRLFNTASIRTSTEFNPQPDEVHTLIVSSRDGKRMERKLLIDFRPPVRGMPAVIKKAE